MPVRYPSLPDIRHNESVPCSGSVTAWLWQPAYTGHFKLVQERLIGLTSNDLRTLASSSEVAVKYSAEYLHPGHAHSLLIQSHCCSAAPPPWSAVDRLFISQDLHGVPCELLFYAQRQHDQGATTVMFHCQMAKFQFLHCLTKTSFQTAPVCRPSAPTSQHHAGAVSAPDLLPQDLSPFRSLVQVQSWFSKILCMSYS